MGTRLSVRNNADKIVDFTDEDLIHLDDAVFAQLKPGALKANASYEGDGAHDGNDRIILDGRKLI